jgi:hypothetical protein
MCLKSDVFIHITCIDMLTKQGKRESAEKALELLYIEKYNAASDASIKPNIMTYTSVVDSI